jgi:circadian clock protein KaiC
VITSGIITGTSKLSRYGIEEFVSEGVIVLGVEMRDGKHVRALYLRKMRSTATDIEEHVFEIVLDRGIVIKE